METRHPLSLPAVKRLAEALENSTGWELVRFDGTGNALAKAGPIELAAPRAAVLVDREIVGYLGLQRSPDADPSTCPDPPTELLRSFADLLGSWIAALSVARDNDEELASLFEITRLLTSTASPDRVQTVLCEAAAKELDSHAAVLFQVDDNEETLSIASSYPPDLMDAASMRKWRSALADSPAEQEALAGTPLLVPWPKDDTRCRHWPPQLRQHEGSAICVGLMAHDRILGTMVVLSDEFREVSLHALRLLQAVANQGALCIEQARLEQDSRTNKILAQDIASASEIQNALLPHFVPKFEQIEIAVHRESCQAIGGDLYDFISIDEDRLGLVIGDACGKSVTGALMMATVRGGLHAYVRDVYNVEEVMRRLNVTINQATLGEYFMTLFYGVLNLKTFQLDYVNGGHNAPLLFHDDRCIELEGGGTILGADPRCEYHVSSVTLSPGDTIVFYTDGLAEAMNASGQLFRDSRIKAIAFEHRHKNAPEILDSLLDAVIAFRDGAPVRDDMTIMVLKVRS